MIINIQRETLIHPLSNIIGVIPNNSTLAILNNFYFKAESGSVTVTGSDSEVESTSVFKSDNIEDGSITVPAKKLYDLCSSLPDGAMINLEAADNKLTIKSKRSKFTLATLDSQEYPLFDDSEEYQNYQIGSVVLKKLISQTAFSMAVNDVRYFLNGLLFDINEDNIKCVSADGHRLALSESNINNLSGSNTKVIVPRKGVLEIQKLIQNTDTQVEIGIGKNHIKVVCNGVSIISKLIDGNFPDYETVIPSKLEKHILIKKDILKSALKRVSILSNKIFKGIKFDINNNQVEIRSANDENEKAEEIIDLESDIGEVKTGFNSAYLLEAIGVIESEEVKLNFGDGQGTSCLITPSDNTNCRLVIMPIRL